MRDRGEVECLDPASGKALWRGSFPKSGSAFYSSPVIANGKLYVARDDGTIFVAHIEPKFEVLADNKMGEQTIASPVPVANRLLIRGDHHLFCIQ